MKHLHILGICGTFMGGLAVLARQLGYTVTGSDQHVYPPMSQVLEAAGVEIIEGYDELQFFPRPDIVIIGNALSRGNPAVEYVLSQHLPYTSGPQWLAENVLQGRQVLAVAGTHGKTTTTSLLTWLLKDAGLNPSYLIGGVAHDMNQSAHCDTGDYFVIEADEYDSAFFDKRSKFLHYRPDVLIMNNLEFDHSDIFPDLEAIKKQFQYLLRSVPANGTVIYPKGCDALQAVLERGCWSETISFGVSGSLWEARAVSDDGSRFQLWHQGKKQGAVAWNMLGQHNVQNALAACAAAYRAGVSFEQMIAGLNRFSGVKRRLEKLGAVNDITLYDDFAHHPTAFATTLAGLRARVGSSRIIALIQFGSNTMLAGEHDLKDIANSLTDADYTVMLKPESATWDVHALAKKLSGKSQVCETVSEIMDHLARLLKPGDQIVIMSNKGFGGLSQKLLDYLKGEISPM